MRRSIAAGLLAIGLAGSVLSAPTSSSAEPRPTPGTPGAERPPVSQADRALTRARDLLAGRGGDRGSRPEATLALRDLFVALPGLSSPTRKQAHSLLGRPTAGADDLYGDGYTVRSTRKCTDVVCLHWVRRTADAPPSTAWVDKNLQTMSRVWRHQVGRLDYRRPVKDGQRGGDGRFDVYLKDLGSRGLYGYCAPERRKPGTEWLASGFCVLDNDFARAQYGAAPGASLRVTAAHEFFHAVQFAYDYGEDGWLMEASATWMEERFADDVDDNRQYLPYGQVRRPGSSLDVFAPTGFTQYGNWAFFEFLSTRYRTGIVRSIWNQAGAFRGAPDRHSVKAVAAVMRRHGGFAPMFARYAAGNTSPAVTYPEGRSWPRADIARSWRLSPSSRSAGDSFRIDHLSSRNVKVTPASSLSGGGWRLRVAVDGPDPRTGSAAHLIVRRVDGRTVREPIRLDSEGRGSARVRFGPTQVRSAVVTLANASTRYTCWQRTQYSCQGLPKDDGRGYAVRLTAVRR